MCIGKKLKLAYQIFNFIGHIAFGERFFFNWLNLILFFKLESIQTGMTGSMQLIVTLPDGSDGKVSACNVGDLGSIPGSGRFPWRRKFPLQYPCLENPMDGGAP